MKITKEQLATITNAKTKYEAWKAYEAIQMSAHKAFKAIQEPDYEAYAAIINPAFKAYENWTAQKPDYSTIRKEELGGVINGN